MLRHNMAPPPPVSVPARDDVKSPFVVVAPRDPSDIKYPKVIPPPPIKQPQVIGPRPITDIKRVVPARFPQNIQPSQESPVDIKNFKHPDVTEIPMGIKKAEASLADVKDFENPHVTEIPMDIKKAEASLADVKDFKNPYVTEIPVGIKNLEVSPTDVKSPEVSPAAKWVPTPPLIALSQAFFSNMGKKRCLDEDVMEKVLPGVSQAFQTGSNNKAARKVGGRSGNQHVAVNEPNDKEEEEETSEMEDVTSLWLWNLLGM